MNCANVSGHATPLAAIHCAPTITPKDTGGEVKIGAHCELEFVGSQA